jgi:cellulose synthase/poly-beta-1,6-N-acetylglucosamine synthase-like glycosyltransferase
MDGLLILLVIVTAGYACFTLFFLTGLWRLNRPSAPAPSSWPTVSVIIAARNEERTLPHLLHDLLQQDYPSDRLEIVVADDRSTDGTPNIIDEIQQQFPQVRGLHITKSNPSMTPKKYALTKALEVATGEIILATDADCRVKPTWVSSMVKEFTPDTGIVVGFSAIDTTQKSFFVRYQAVDFLGLMAANAGAIGWGRNWSGSGQNLAYRRKNFEAIHGFLPVAHQVSGDDMYLVQAISRQARLRFNVNPESFVTTAPVPRVTTFLAQHIRWASNSRKALHSDPLFLTFLVTAFLCNTLLLFGLVFHNWWPWVTISFGVKFTLDALVVFTGAQRFDQTVDPAAYCAWNVAQPVYIPLVGLLGLAGKFKWK